MSIFTCCERLDETKYLHPCACPIASFTCVSEEFSPSLCGNDEYVDELADPPVEASLPPKKYRNRRAELMKLDVDRWVCCEGVHTKSFQSSMVTPGSSWQQWLTDPLTCNEVYTYDFSCSVAGNSWDCDGNTYPVSGGCSGIDMTWSYYETVSTTRKVWYKGRDELFISGDCAGKNGHLRRMDTHYTLSDEDTEEDALARETPVAGTSCSSRWESRETAFSWLKRTAGYTIECTNLVAGLSYKVYPTIQKRPVTDNSEGAWEPVTVAPVTINATGTTYTLDDNGSPIQLDHIQGWEYQIINVDIEKA